MMKNDQFDGLAPRARARDVARAAGVSTATVDRVLNRRPGVRDATIQRVLKACAQLDYLADAHLHAAARKPMQLAFLLPAGTNRYLRMLGETVGTMEDQLAPFNVRCKAHTIEGFKRARAGGTLAAPRTAQRRRGLHGARSSARARGSARARR